MMGTKFLFGALFAALLLANCSSKERAAAEPKAEAAAPTVTEESLGLRKTDLYSEKSTVAEKTEYGSAAPGTSERFERAFVNAPPMIPHSVEGLLPITTNSNQCVSCHMPEVAPVMNATPIPASHFASFRPVTQVDDAGNVIKEGQKITNTSDIVTVVHNLDTLSSARYNCSQCHAPQSTGDVLVENRFNPDFGDDRLKKSSNLLDTLNEGVE